MRIKCEPMNVQVMQKDDDWLEILSALFYQGSNSNDYVTRIINGLMDSAFEALLSGSEDFKTFVSRVEKYSDGIPGLTYNPSDEMLGKLNLSKDELMPYIINNKSQTSILLKNWMGISYDTILSWLISSQEKEGKSVRGSQISKMFDILQNTYQMEKYDYKGKVVSDIFYSNQDIKRLLLDKKKMISYLVSCGSDTWKMSNFMRCVQWDGVFDGKDLHKILSLCAKKGEGDFSPLANSEVFKKLVMANKDVDVKEFIFAGASAPLGLAIEEMRPNSISDRCLIHSLEGGTKHSMGGIDVMKVLEGRVVDERIRLGTGCYLWLLDAPSTLKNKSMNAEILFKFMRDCTDNGMEWMSSFMENNSAKKKYSKIAPVFERMMLDQKVKESSLRKGMKI